MARTLRTSGQGKSAGNGDHGGRPLPAERVRKPIDEGIDGDLIMI
jgi:hypothetical protein